MKRYSLIVMLVLLPAIVFTPAMTFAADIKPALVETFGNEGGLQCSKTDPGNQRADGTWGCTKFGISQRSYPNMDIRNSTLDDAVRIYERDFWKPLQLDKVESQIIANAVFDASVNQGTPTWQKKLAIGIQETINLSSSSQTDVVAVDGILGPKTIAMLNKVDQVVLYTNIIGLQYERYRAIVKKNPKMKEWYRGWMKRVARTVTKAVHDRDAMLAKQKN